MKTKSDILLATLFRGDSVNLLDYAGNLRHEICYKATWAIAAEKENQADRIRAIIAAMRDMGQDNWAELLIKYLKQFKISIPEDVAQ